MKFTTSVLLVMIGTLWQGQVLAEGDTRTKHQVYFNYGHIVLDEDGSVTRFVTPRELADLGRFQVRIPRPKPDQLARASEAAAPPTLSERIEARRIMQEANEAFFQGDLTRSWDLVARAEALDPQYYRIKTMKGSLLYKIGSHDLAMEIWQESLTQNPNQPEIMQMLTTLQGHSIRTHGMATGVPTEKPQGVSRQ